MSCLHNITYKVNTTSICISVQTTLQAVNKTRLITKQPSHFSHINCESETNHGTHLHSLTFVLWEILCMASRLSEELELCSGYTLTNQTDIFTPHIRGGGGGDTAS